MKKKVWMTWILTGAAVIGSCFTTYADPAKTSSDLKKYVEGVQTESVGIAAEVKDISSQLSEKNEAAAQAKNALAQSETARSQAMQALQERIGIICANGGTDWLSEVLATGDISIALNNGSDLTEEDIQVLQMFSDAVKEEASCRMDVAEVQEELNVLASNGEAKQSELKTQMAVDQQEIENYVKEIASSEAEEMILLEECQGYQSSVCQEALEAVFVDTEYVDMVKEEEAVDMVTAEVQVDSEEAAAVVSAPEPVADNTGYVYAEPYAVTEETTNLYGYDYVDPYAVTEETTDLYGYDYVDPYAVTEETTDLYGYGYTDLYAAAEEIPETTEGADPYGYGDTDLYAATEETTDVAADVIAAEPEYSVAYDTVEEPMAEVEEEETADTSYMNPIATTTTHSDFLGDFTITAYCGCAQCCGAAGQPTASGVMPTAGRTCAMYGIDFGTQLMINGQVYTVEDRGTPYGHVDLYFNTHEEALAFGRQTAEVYQVY